jgi:hypothetical protein
MHVKPQYKIPLLYFVFGVTWILVTDVVAGMLAEGPAQLALLQTVKGWGFIAVTTLLLHYFVFRSVQRTEAAQAEKVEVFHRTMRSVQHIMNNFLNRMLDFKMRAEDAAALNDEMLREFEGFVYETSNRITQLSELQDLDAWRLASGSSRENVPV